MKEIKKNKEKVMVDTRGKSGYRRSKIGYRSKGGYRRWEGKYEDFREMRICQRLFQISSLFI